MSRYKTELDTAVRADLARAERLHAVAQHPEVPDFSAARWYALALGRWRVGCRNTRPLPPSSQITVEAVHMVEEVVERFVPFSRGAGMVPGPPARTGRPVEVSAWLREDDEAAA